MSAGGPTPTRTARVLFAAIATAAFVATAVLGMLRATITGSMTSSPPIPPAILRAGMMVLLAGATLVLRILRATLPEGTRDPDAWWAANLGRAVSLWALMDGAAIMGAVAFVLTGDLLILALAAGWAAAMFVGYSPGRLTAG